MATISTHTGKKNFFLSVALGSLAVASFCMGEAKASWSAPRCAAQCKAALFAGGKIGNSQAIGRIAPGKVQGKASGAYKKLLNDCAANCDNIPIKDALVSNTASLSPENLKGFRGALESEINKKNGALKAIQAQLAGQDTKKLSSSKMKDLRKKEGALNSEIAALNKQISQIQQSLPKINLENDVLEKVAHPEDKEFVEPTIPEIKGFADDPATTTQKDGKTVLTKWGIVKILQETGIVVKRDPHETRTVEGSVKVNGKSVQVTKLLGKEDSGKIIANDPEPSRAGLYSEVVYFVNVNPHYLASGHTQTRYVLKKNRWAPQLERGVKTRTENTPAKELIDLKKVRAYIVPQLKGAKYAKIAAIGESAFYFDEQSLSQSKGSKHLGVRSSEKHYFVVLDAADGGELSKLFDQYARADNAKWRQIIFNVGRAVGELHGLLSDTETSKILAQNLKLSDIKTIPHGDMHMGNIFYNEHSQNVTFIDTGSMADSLRTKRSPIIDLVQIFGTTKYFHRIYNYDFSQINMDFAPFSEGYAQGFTPDKERQVKIKELVNEYFKGLSTEFGESISLKALNSHPSHASSILQDPYSRSVVGSYINNYLYSYVHNGGGQGNQNFWWLVRKVFLDDYVSRDVRRELGPALLHHKLITQQEADSQR